MAKNKSELVAKAIELEIELKGDETVEQLEELIANADDSAVKDLQKQAKEKQAEKKKESFSREEVMKIIEENNRRLREEMGKNKNPEDSDEVNPFEVKKFKNPIVRIARLKNKFITGFKNLNDDEYNPNLVIHTTNVAIKNQVTGRMEFQPFATLEFHDGTVEENYPVLSLMDRAIAVECEVIEVKEEDVSYSQGLVDQKDTLNHEGYENIESTRRVKAIVKQKNTVYVVREPKNGETFTVQKEVINLVA